MQEATPRWRSLLRFMATDNEEPSDSMRVLLLQLGEKRLNLLVDLIKEVQDQSGYGGVEIVLAGGKVQTIKMIKSFK